MNNLVHNLYNNKNTAILSSTRNITEHFFSSILTNNNILQNATNHYELYFNIQTVPKFCQYWNNLLKNINCTNYIINDSYVGKDICAENPEIFLPNNIMNLTDMQKHIYIVDIPFSKNIYRSFKGSFDILKYWIENKQRQLICIFNKCCTLNPYLLTLFEEVIMLKSDTSKYSNFSAFSIIDPIFFKFNRRRFRYHTKKNNKFYFYYCYDINEQKKIATHKIYISNKDDNNVARSFSLLNLYCDDHVISYSDMESYSETESQSDYDMSI
jgi:hypothetical protein